GPTSPPAWAPRSRPWPGSRQATPMCASRPSSATPRRWVASSTGGSASAADHEGPTMNAQWMPPNRPPTPRDPPPVPLVPIPLDDNSVLDRLLARRIVLLSGPLDHRLATDAAAQLMLLDASGDDPIELHLSCPDGE